MKCLLCTRNFQDTNLLKNHYIVEYKSNPNNWFFKALFERGKERSSLIRIFLILLNANLTSAKKITKIIKQSTKLAINLWPGQKQLLDEMTDQQYLCQDRREDQTSDSLEPETNAGKQN